MKMVTSLLIGLTVLALPASARNQPPPPEQQSDKPEACDSNGEACPQDAQPQNAPSRQTDTAKPPEDAPEACDANGEACPNDKPAPKPGAAQLR
jgi:hypothetical protein